MEKAKLSAELRRQQGAAAGPVDEGVDTALLTGSPEVCSDPRLRLCPFLLEKPRPSFLRGVLPPHLLLPAAARLSSDPDTFRASAEAGNVRNVLSVSRPAVVFLHVPSL